MFPGLCTELWAVCACADLHRVVVGRSEAKTGLLAKLLSSTLKEGGSARVSEGFLSFPGNVGSEPWEPVQASEVSPQPPSCSLSLNLGLTTSHVHSAGPHLAWFCWKLHPRAGRGSGLRLSQQQIPEALTGWFSSKDLKVLNSQARLFGVMTFAGPKACLPAPVHGSSQPPNSHHFGSQNP